MQRVMVLGLWWCAVSVTPVWSQEPPVPPSCSFGSGLLKGTKLVFMKGNLDCACYTLYGVVESFFFLSWSPTALSKCHQQSCIFGFKISHNVPISAISLSTCVKMGMTLYLSHRHVTQADRAFVCLPILTADDVNRAQYDSGKPVLSYSAITLYNSRFLEFVLTVNWWVPIYDDHEAGTLTCCINCNLNYLPFEPTHHFLYTPAQLLNTLSHWNFKHMSTHSAVFLQTSADIDLFSIRSHSFRSMLHGLASLWHWDMRPRFVLPKNPVCSIPGAHKLCLMLQMAFQHQSKVCDHHGVKDWSKWCGRHCWENHPTFSMRQWGCCCSQISASPLYLDSLHLGPCCSLISAFMWHLVSTIAVPCTLIELADDL